MSSNESFIKQWQSIAPSEQVDIGLVLVEIASHRHPTSDFASLQLEHLKDLLRDCFHAVAEKRGGKLLSWDGNGGAFMFLAENQESYDNCCLAAIQMLEMMPSLNQDLRSTNDPAFRVEVRILCDSGVVAYHAEPSNLAGDFLKKLAGYARHIAENWVTITEQIYRQLSPHCRAQFVHWKYSPELDVDLYRTPLLHDIANPDSVADSSPKQAADAARARGVVDDTAPTRKRLVTRLAPGRPRRLTGLIRPWQVAVIAVVALLVGQLFILRAVFPPALLPAAPAVTGWDEQVRSPEWIAWRNRVHEILSSTQLTEETLAEALRVKSPEVRSPPAAILRHDQAIGDVLQSYPRVRALLRTRLGIYEQFLGTGYSNPVNAVDYASASLHEYLIPNLPDDSPRVWMRKIKLQDVVEALDKTIKDLIEEKTQEDQSRQVFKRAIISNAEAGHKETVLIRFAILDAKKDQYKGTLGHPDRERVFACDLAEVWNLKINDAADRSGFTLSKGEGEGTLFVWVFMPATKHEAVLATWGQVLEHLPEWMEEAQIRHP